MLHTVNTSYTKTTYFSDESNQVQCKSTLFEIMLTLAQDTVDSFKSDFYHDAIFLYKLDTSKPFEFYFLFGDTGTTIIRKGESGLSAQALAMQCRKYSRPFVYKVELLAPIKPESIAWEIVCTCLATDKEELPSYNERISFNYSALYDQNTPE